MIDKIYLVTSGEYSDYTVEGAFSTREKAEAYLAHFHTDPRAYHVGRIEEYALDPHERTIREGLREYRVRMDTEGNVEKVELRSGALAGEYVETGRGPYGPATWGVALARDEKHAIKIVNERRIMMLAQGVGTMKFGREGGSAC